MLFVALRPSIIGGISGRLAVIQVAPLARVLWLIIPPSPARLPDTMKAGDKVEFTIEICPKRGKPVAKNVRFQSNVLFKKI